MLVWLSRRGCLCRSLTTCAVSSRTKISHRHSLTTSDVNTRLCTSDCWRTSASDELDSLSACTTRASCRGLAWLSVCRLSVTVAWILTICSGRSRGGWGVRWVWQKANPPPLHLCRVASNILWSHMASEPCSSVMDGVFHERTYCGFNLWTMCCGDRYKMLSTRTWPNYRGGSDRNGTQVIIDECRASQDVQYGKTKVFVRSPQTLFELERRRTEKIPSICITLQRVSSH